MILQKKNKKINIIYYTIFLFVDTVQGDLLKIGHSPMGYDILDASGFSTC